MIDQGFWSLFINHSSAMLDALSFTVACIKKELNFQPIARDRALFQSWLHGPRLGGLQYPLPWSSYKNYIQCRNRMIPKPCSPSPSNMADSFANISSILLCNEILNPLTPMAFLPPHLAFEAKISELVIACSLAVCFSIGYIRLVKLGADQM